MDANILQDSQSFLEDNRRSGIFRATVVSLSEIQDDIDRLDCMQLNTIENHKNITSMCQNVAVIKEYTEYSCMSSSSNHLEESLVNELTNTFSIDGSLTSEPPVTQLPFQRDQIRNQTSEHKEFNEETSKPLECSDKSCYNCEYVQEKGNNETISEFDNNAAAASDTSPDDDTRDTDISHEQNLSKESFTKQPSIRRKILRKCMENRISLLGGLELMKPLEDVDEDNGQVEENSQEKNSLSISVDNLNSNNVRSFNNGDALPQDSQLKILPNDSSTITDAISVPYVKHLHPDFVEKSIMTSYTAETLQNTKKTSETSKEVKLERRKSNNNYLNLSDESLPPPLPASSTPLLTCSSVEESGHEDAIADLFSIPQESTTQESQKQIEEMSREPNEHNKKPELHLLDVQLKSNQTFDKLNLQDNAHEDRNTDDLVNKNTNGQFHDHIMYAANSVQEYKHLRNQADSEIEEKISVKPINSDKCSHITDHDGRNITSLCSESVNECTPVICIDEFNSNSQSVSIDNRHQNQRTSPPPPLPPKSVARFMNSRRCTIPSEDRMRSSVPPVLPPKSRNLVNRNSFYIPRSRFIEPENHPEGPSLSSNKLEVPYPSIHSENTSCPIKYSDLPPKPTYCRSLSSSEAYKEETRAKTHECDRDIKSEPPTIGRCEGLFFKTSLTEAVNTSIGSEHVKKLSTRFERFPVHVDVPHQRLSAVSRFPMFLHEDLSPVTYDNDAFTFSSTNDVSEAINSECVLLPSSCSDDKEDGNHTAHDINSVLFDFTSDSSQLQNSRPVKRLSSKYSKDKLLLSHEGVLPHKKLSKSSSVSQLLNYYDDDRDSSTDQFNRSIHRSFGKGESKTTAPKLPTQRKHRVAKISRFVSTSLRNSFQKISSRRSTDSLSRTTSNCAAHDKQSEDVRNKQGRSSVGAPLLSRIARIRESSILKGKDSHTESFTLLDQGPESPNRLDHQNEITFQHNSNRSFSFKPERSSSIYEDTVFGSRNSADTNNFLDNFSVASLLIDQQRLSGDTTSLLTDITDLTTTATNRSNKFDIIDGLKVDMKNYQVILKELAETYNIMRAKTPDGIRQHFDRAFNEIQKMIHLEEKLNKKIEASNYDIELLSEEFLSKDFTVYKKYTVLVNTICKEMKNHAAYFSENFVDLGSKITVPSRRLNTYGMHLKSLQEVFYNDVNQNLNTAIEYLENLKSQANTDMTINAFQNCPIELHLCGLMRKADELVYKVRGVKKRLYVMVFSDIIVMAKNNYKSFVYKTHIRSPQILDIYPENQLQFAIKTTENFLGDTQNHSFQTRSVKERDNWISFFQTWKEENKTSYSSTALNHDLLAYLPAKPERFLPLSLWQLSPRLKESVDGVKTGQVAVQIERHLSQNPFQYFLEQEEKYIEKLNVLLDPEAMPPPPILGSSLRKLRRLHNGCFLPKLKDAYKTEPSCALDCFIGNLPNLPCLYKEFIEIRANLTLSMVDGESVRLYVAPIHHLAFYITWLHYISLQPKYHPKVRGELSILLNCVEDARVILLHTAIHKCKMDFHKAGDIVFKGFLKSNVKIRHLKQDVQYYAILFQKALVFTKFNLPNYDFVQEVWLDQITMGPKSDCPFSFKIQERTAGKERMYDLRAEFETQKQQWIQEISLLLNKQAILVKTKVSE